MALYSSLIGALARASDWLRHHLSADGTEPVARRAGLIATLRADRLLLWVTVGLAALALLPLFMAAILPLSDLPNTTACAALVPKILWGKGLPAEVYQVRWGIYPTWTPLILIAAISSMTNVLFAAKVIAALTVLLIPLATMRLMIACNRDPRLGVLAFSFSYQLDFYAGWVGFLLGMGLAMWALAWLIEAETVREALRVAVLGGIIGLTHAQSTLYFVVAVLALTFARAGRRPLRRLALHALAGTGIMVLFMPWVFGVSPVQSGGGLLASLFRADDPLQDRLRDLWRFTFDVFARPDDVRVAARVLAMLLMAPMLLALVPIRSGASKAIPATLFLVICFLYASMPMTLTSPVYQWYVYPRFAGFVLLSALLVPRPDLRGRRAAWLLPGIAMIVALLVHTATQFHDWDQRSRPFLQVIAAVRENSRVLPLEMIDEDPAFSPHPTNQLHAYIAAMRSSYSPHLWRNEAYPFRYRPAKDLPSPEPIAGGDTFDLDTYGPYYDYVLVQGKSKDPVAGQATSKTFRADVVLETELFRLYQIHRLGG